MIDTKPWSTLNHRLCHKPIPSTWQRDSLLIPSFECDSVLTLRSILPPTSWFCNSTHSTCKCQNPKITSNVTPSRIISIGTRDLRFSYIWTEVLLILWCWRPNFIFIKENYTQNYIRPQAALTLGQWMSVCNAAVTCCSQLDVPSFLLSSAQCLLQTTKVCFQETRCFTLQGLSSPLIFLFEFSFFLLFFPIFSCSRETI